VRAHRPSSARDDRDERGAGAALGDVVLDSVEGLAFEPSGNQIVDSLLIDARHFGGGREPAAARDILDRYASPARGRRGETIV